MSLYILDTDTLSLYERQQAEVTRRIKACPPSELAITVITVEEQLTGWYDLLRNVKKPEDLARAYQRLTESITVLSGLRVLSFTEAAIARYQSLRVLKLNVGKYDLRIAAIALEQGATVVTRNVRDFGRVPNLVIEDWTI